jgi:hypothetical protein
VTAQLAIARPPDLLHDPSMSPRISARALPFER